MPIQTLVKDVTSTLETFFYGARPTSCTVTLKTDRAATKINAAAATVDTVNTTTSAAVAAGATTIAVDSASGIVSSRRYILGVDASTAPQEVVTVKSVASSTATLFAATLFAHNSGDTFAGGRVSYDVPAASCDTTFWDGYAVFTPLTGDPITEVVDCALRKIPDDLISISDVQQVFPRAKEMLCAVLDVSKALTEARVKIMQDVGGPVRTSTMIGNEEFKYAASLAFWLRRRYAFGDEWVETYDKMAEDYEHVIAKLRAQIPADVDQDGITSGREDGGRTMPRLERA